MHLAERKQNQCVKKLFGNREKNPMLCSASSNGSLVFIMNNDKAQQVK